MVKKKKYNKIWNEQSWKTTRWDQQRDINGIRTKIKIILITEGKIDKYLKT